MLTDPTQSEKFRTSKAWQSPLLDFKLRVENDSVGGPVFRSNSLSGNERNRLLIAADGHFHDESLVSGVDCKEDARSFAVFDFDNDGWLDIVLASPNAPRLRIFKNRMGELGHKGRMTRLKLTGSASNRDACGALVTVETTKGSRVYRNALGEGLSSQNSKAIRLTLGENEILKSLEIRWPSGKVTKQVVEGAPRSISITE